MNSALMVFDLIHFLREYAETNSDRELIHTIEEAERVALDEILGVDIRRDICPARAFEILRMALLADLTKENLLLQDRTN